MLTVFAIVGVVICYSGIVGMMAFFFAFPPTEIVGSPRPRARLQAPLTPEEAQLMRAFDLA